MISYHKKEQEWVADQLTPEEVERLIEIGKEELIKRIAVQLFQMVMPNAEEAILATTPNDQMGQA